MATAGQLVGLVGVGNLGGRIARRIMETGQPMVGFHRDPAKVERWGMSPRASLQALVADADTVLLCLPDSTAVESVVLGDEGVLAGLRAGQVVVDLTTARPASTRAVAEAVSAKGASFLDAGVSGGARSAERGTSTLMVGGSEEALEQVRPVLARFATYIYYMGPSGSGHTMKLLNNFLSALTLAASSEVMVGAKLAGLDVHRALEVINHSSGRSYATETRFPHIVEGDYLAGGLSINLMTKDVVQYIQMMEDLGGTLFNASGCLATFRAAEALGMGGVINNRVVDAIGDLVGGLRLHSQGGGDGSAS